MYIVYYFRSANQSAGGTSNGIRTSFPKRNKVSALKSPDYGKQSSREKALVKKDSSLQNPTPKTQTSAITGSRSNVGNSQPALGSGLEASFASLRRSSATPDLLNTSSVFDPSEKPYTSSKPSSAGTRSSSPRLKRPPTKESRSVSICETEVHDWCSWNSDWLLDCTIQCLMKKESTIISENLFFVKIKNLYYLELKITY